MQTSNPARDSPASSQYMLLVRTALDAAHTHGVSVAKGNKEVRVKSLGTGA